MKWYTYLICFILIIIGTFAGIRLYKEVKAESYVNGSIDISNNFSQESFNYSTTSFAFYEDIYSENEDEFIFNQDLVKVNDFNGRTKQYEVYLNDFILLDTDFNAGSIFSVANMDFYDEYGDVVCSSSLNISIRFLSNKTELRLSISGLENAMFFEQYFADNGFRLKVLEIY